MHLLLNKTFFVQSNIIILDKGYISASNSIDFTKYISLTFCEIGSQKNITVISNIP